MDFNFVFSPFMKKLKTLYPISCKNPFHPFLLVQCEFIILYELYYGTCTLFIKKLP